MADDENKTAHAEPEPEIQRILDHEYEQEKPDPTSGEESMEKSEDDETGQGEEQLENMKEEDGDDESDEESDAKEELPPGLLEQPLEVQGKREKKKVERLSATMTRVPEKKKVEIEEGSGVKLSEVPFIENQVNTTKAIDLKQLHRLLFLRIGTQLEVKRNIRQFCGFTHAKDSKEYERRVTMLSKMVLTELKSITSVLGLERKGTKQEIIDRIMDFLIKPTDLGLKIGEKKGKRGRKSGTKPKVVKRKRSSKKTETKKIKSKPNAKSKSKKENDDDDDEGGDDDEDAVSDEEEGDEDGEEVEEEEEEEEESEDEAPKKKKRKVEPKKKSPKVSKVNGKKEKSPKKETKKVTKKETKKAPKKSASPKKKVADDISDSLSDDSDSSEDECVANLKKKMPPSNDTIKELVKKILDGADLETVTMKTVVKQVYSEYPSFDLSDRKDFIKDSVREIIS